MNSFTRNGQNVTFTTDEYGSLVQTSPFRSSTDGKPIPLLDYEIDGTRIIASNAGIARQAHQQWKTDTDAEDTMTETADQRVNRYRLEGAELAAIALSDRPDDEAAIDNATDAGATWGKTSGMYYLAMPNSMDTIAVIEADGDISFGSSIDQYRN